MTHTYYHPAAIVESQLIGAGTRVWAYAHVMAGAQVGENCNLGEHTFIESGATLGRNVTVKNNVCVWMGVTLGDDVFVGPSAIFTNDRFPRSPRMAQARSRYTHTEKWLLPTIVKQGASIGAGAIILPGVRIGQYSTIAAGALVTADVPPFALMIGAPARQVGWMCRCGQKLEGDYQTATCPGCGETPQMRCPEPEMESAIL
jgi:UDP-2-acetamido-3-amino-2,3-dideoxy-glucuronate N-acetyltransferase